METAADPRPWPKTFVAFRLDVAACLRAVLEEVPNVPTDVRNRIEMERARAADVNYESGILANDLFSCWDGCEYERTRDGEWDPDENGYRGPVHDTLSTTFYRAGARGEMEKRLTEAAVSWFLRRPYTRPF